jgi:endoglucanase
MIRSTVAVLCCAVCLLLLTTPARAAKLIEVRSVDDETVMVYWHDAEVEWKDTGKGPTAFRGGCDSAGEVIHKFDTPLDTAAAGRTENYELTSDTDRLYASPVHPAAAHRKTKVSGTDRGWPDCNCTLEHTVYLRFPKKLKQGATYTLRIKPAVKSSANSKEFTFDVFSSISEAVHVNIIGYNPDITAMKSADLYMWLGDGGSRDYFSYVGKKVMLYDTARKTPTDVGRVTFWKKAGPDLGGWDLTRSDVWNCDFSAFKTPGVYRLAVEGVGCSPPFVLSRSAYYEPFKTSLRGYYYMRIGEGKEWAARQHLPIPRQPAFIPGKNPAGFKVILTTYGPFHEDWKKAGGDQWDNQDWSKYVEPGMPTNANAWGGHSDATDWDRHLGHVSNIWDLLLPYLLSGGRVGDDNCQIPESGNGIPDLIDEANYETDFWLRLRDTRGGYSCGLNNPSQKDTVMYQAAALPYMAWASAANAAMTADALRVAQMPELVKKYTAAAIEAWKTANEQGLDLSYSIGNGAMRGRDLKFMAAAYLYNVTGQKTYEDAIVKECSITSPSSEIDSTKSNQLWGAVAYVLCARDKLQPIHHPKLADDMRSAIINEALTKNVANSTTWPSRRSCNNAYGWFQSTQEVQTVCAAHAFSTDQAQRESLLRALVLEADWGLGRNPMNIVQMTGLGSRCPRQIFTCGRNDGVPGVHPGHTPYMNVDAWGSGYQFDPRFYANKGYPEWSKWPHAEALWPAPYCFANNEFTPQQTMRGKMCLYTYLYALGDTPSP